MTLEHLQKERGRKGISVHKLVLFGRFCLASNGSFLKLLNFTMSGGCLLTGPSIFIHLPSARNPPSCSPSDENSRDVSQPALMLQAGFPCWLQGSRSVLSPRTGRILWGGMPGKGGGEGEPQPSFTGPLYLEAMNLHGTDLIKSTHLGQLREGDFYASDLLQTFRHFCLAWQASHLLLSSVGRSAVLSDSPGEVRSSAAEGGVLGSIPVSLMDGPASCTLWSDPRAPQCSPIRKIRLRVSLSH